MSEEDQPWIYLTHEERMEWQRRKNAQMLRMVGEIAGIKIIANPNMKPDEFVIGYPDGKGGLKTGALKGKL